MNSLCFKSAKVGGISLGRSPAPAGGGVARASPARLSALGRGTANLGGPRGMSMEHSPPVAPPTLMHSISDPMTYLWPAAETRSDEGSSGPSPSPPSAARSAEGEEGRRENWVLKILQVRSVWRERDGAGDGGGCGSCNDEEESGGGDGDGDGEEEETIEMEKETFGRLLRRVSVMEAKLYAQLAYLGYLAYAIPNIKPRILLKRHGLCFVTSSLEKKAQCTSAKTEQELHLEKEEPVESEQSKLSVEMTEEMEKGEEVDEQPNRLHQRRLSAYRIAAAAASYLQSHTRSILHSRSGGNKMDRDKLQGSANNTSSKVAFVATANSVTAVVAGKEEMKEAVAEGLNSASLSPCEWFVCDDESRRTRIFVIQGSGSLASWQANLLFEPIQFEGLDVLVHRGIYEAAKGIYEQILPEVRAHLESRGNSATFRFTGHSLGGSLAVLLNLMILIRGETPISSLLPVVTFGSPFIICGGDRLLRELCLPSSHVQAVMMHRDIVPRVFSCNYPDHVVELLKAVNGNFRSHPYLMNQKFLYAPMGRILILQPEEKFSPPHHLLPSGSGLYLLGDIASDSDEMIKQIRAAESVLLNSPHPLEILSDPSSYRADGTIIRDHDMSFYLCSLRSIICQELKHIRKVKRVHPRKMFWSFDAPGGLKICVIVGQRAEKVNEGLHQLPFSAVLQKGKESLERIRRLLTSENDIKMLVVLLFPTRLLLVGKYSFIGLFSFWLA